uniref:Uncharacterized protein n=1 Tax=Myotis myotis TaxID=51298 RepID=A0A7J8AND2_MYOMY|nr:hypothetical protein mMyoMyo1_008216 [Myotis myotis]
MGRIYGSDPPGPLGSGFPRPRSLCVRTPHVYVAPLFSKVLLCWSPPGILTAWCLRGGNRGRDTRMCDGWGGRGAGAPGSSPSALRCTRALLAPSQSSLRRPSAHGPHANLRAPPRQRPRFLSPSRAREAQGHAGGRRWVSAYWVPLGHSLLVPGQGEGLNPESQRLTRDSPRSTFTNRRNPPSKS